MARIEIRTCSGLHLLQTVLVIDTNLGLSSHQRIRTDRGNSRSSAKRSRLVLAAGAAWRTPFFQHPCIQERSGDALSEGFDRPSASGEGRKGL